MLSFIALVVQVGAIIHGDFSNQRIKRESKERAIENNSSTYIDRFGKEYDVNTDRKVYLAFEKGNKVLKDCKTSEVVRNITLEQGMNQYKINRDKAIQKGKRFFRDPIKKMYCEVATGKYYRQHNNVNRVFCTWYVDVEDDNHRVYEYGEGPSDEEIIYRDTLYKNYKEISDRYDELYCVNEFSFDGGRDSEDYKKLEAERSKLFWEKKAAEEKMHEHDNAMRRKYTKNKR